MAAVMSVAAIRRRHTQKLARQKDDDEKTVFDSQEMLARPALEDYKIRRFRFTILQMWDWASSHGAATFHNLIILHTAAQQASRQEWQFCGSELRDGDLRRVA